MREIGAFEAKNTFGTLLDYVERGQEILITRHGKPIARLILEGDVRSKERALEAVMRIRDRRLKRKKSPLSVKELIAYKNEGRQ